MEVHFKLITKYVGCPTSVLLGIIDTNRKVPSYFEKYLFLANSDSIFFDAMDKYTKLSYF